MAHDRILKAVAFGCTHFPLNDPAATAWVLELIAKEKPDVVAYLGDGLEANASSRWPDAEDLGIALETEFAAHNAFLAAVRKAAPKARRVYREGNHDGNLLAPGRIDKRLRSLCDWSRPKNQPEWEIGKWELGKPYNYSRRLGCSWLGPQLCLTHGHATTAGGKDLEARYFLKNSPFGLLVAAHTHSPHDLRSVKPGDFYDEPRWYINVGTLRDMDAHYMERNNKSMWGQAAAVIDFLPKPKRKAREWDARLELFRMYDDVKGAA